MKDVCIARGDGIGPEIVDACLRILEAARAPLRFHELHIDARLGGARGISARDWDSLDKHPLFLKGPLATPQGGGFTSVNLSLRAAFGLSVCYRPCISYAPLLHSRHPDMDVLIIRENEEGLYSGIEYRPLEDLTESLRLITRPASQRVIRYAFALAAKRNRKKVTCFTKDNILKMSDGLFHQIFDEVALEYPQLHAEHKIVDIGMAHFASHPEDFDVLVMPNLYGDILSDIAAEISGSVGLAGSVNIGDNFSMFEAIHGSAPDIAGQGIANPSGLLLAALMLLDSLSFHEVADRIYRSWCLCLEKGLHTADLFSEKSSKKLGTQAFAQAVIDHLGESPSGVYKERACPLPAQKPVSAPIPQKRLLTGVDVFVNASSSYEDILSRIQKASSKDFSLDSLRNAGRLIWPQKHLGRVRGSYWCLRFFMKDTSDFQAILSLLTLLNERGGFEIIKTQNLYSYDSTAGYRD